MVPLQQWKHLAQVTLCNQQMQACLDWSAQGADPFWRLTTCIRMHCGKPQRLIRCSAAIAVQQTTVLAGSYCRSNLSETFNKHGVCYISYRLCGR